MLHGIGGTQGEEVVIGQVVESLPLFLIFGFLSVSSAHLGHQNQNLQIFGNLQIFLLIFAIFSQFFAIFVHLGLPPEHSGQKNEKNLIFGTFFHLL